MYHLLFFAIHVYKQIDSACVFSTGLPDKQGKGCFFQNLITATMASVNMDKMLEIPKTVWCFITMKQLVFLALSLTCFCLAFVDMDQTVLADSHRTAIQTITWVSFGLSALGSLISGTVEGNPDKYKICAQPVSSAAFLRHLGFAIVALFFTYVGFNSKVDDPMVVITGLTHVNGTITSPITGAIDMNRYHVTYAPILVIFFAVDMLLTVNDGVWEAIVKIVKDPKMVLEMGGIHTDIRRRKTEAYNGGV